MGGGEDMVGEGSGCESAHDWFELKRLNTCTHTRSSKNDETNYESAQGYATLCSHALMLPLHAPSLTQQQDDARARVTV